PGPAAAGSARVVLDDELLVHRYHDLLALGAVKQGEPQVAEVYVEVGGGALVGVNPFRRGDERLLAARPLAHAHRLAGLDLVAGVAHLAAVDADVAVGDVLAGRVDRRSHAGAQHERREPGLEQGDQLRAGAAGAAPGELPVAAQRPLGHVVVPAQLLLLQQPGAVVAHGAAV